MWNADDVGISSIFAVAAAVAATVGAVGIVVLAVILFFPAIVLALAVGI